MRFVVSTIVFLIVSLAVGKTSGMGQSPAAPPKITVLTTELRAKILDAMRLLARTVGVFAEPAGATPIAGLLKLAREGRLDPGAPCVAIVTGSGLKDAESAFAAAGSVPDPIPPTLEALEKRLSRS